MFSRDIRRHLLVALALVLGISIADPGARCQTITVGLGSSHIPFSTNFFGLNGEQRNNVPWNHKNSSGQYYNPGLLPVLQSLKGGLFRFPAGTYGNYWNWSTGDFVTGYSIPWSAPSAYPSPLGELQAELASASQPTGTQTQALFVLNALTDPLCASGCTLSTSSPNEAYQLQMLAQAVTDGLSLPYLELGNEYDLSCYNADCTDYQQVYPTGQDYAKLANKWIADIKAKYPSVKIAVVGAWICSGCVTRRNTWNNDMFNGAYPLTGADAVQIHRYMNTGLPSGSTIDNTTAKTMLLQPFLQCDDFVQNTVPTLQNTSGSYTPAIWFTEYNLTDADVPAFGTWAHALYLTTQDFLFGLQNNRVQMAESWTTQQSQADHSLIFESTSAFCPPSSTTLTYPADGCSITTVVNGLSATGLSQQVVLGATLGQTAAQQLTFPGGPTFDGTHPQLLGWKFTGAANKHAVLLNLDNVAETVNVSGVVSSGTYSQIYGDAGAYVTGATVSGGYQAYLDTADNGLQLDNLKLNSGTLNPSTLTLPAFSITDITF